MSSFLLLILTVVTLAAAAYAQLRIPRFTAGRSKVIATRATLIVIGIAFGYVAAATYADDRLLAVLAFLSGFGTVHIPAALILFIKRERHAGKS